MKKAPKLSSDLESNSLHSRRGFIRGLLAAPVASYAVLTPTLAHAENPFETSPYHHLRQNFEADLDPKGKPEEIQFAVDSQPPLFYEHDVRGKWKTKEDINILKESKVFELAKLAWAQIEGQYTLAKTFRRTALEKLAEASAPGLETQKEMTQLYEDYYEFNEEMVGYWSKVVEQARKLIPAVQKVVEKERQAAVKMKHASEAQDKVPGIKLVKLKAPDDKKAAEINEHSKDYENIEAFLKPEPYACDDFDTSLMGEPSSVGVIESLKTLKAFARFHYETAVKRRGDYKSLQSYIKIMGKPALKLKKYDGTRYNDPLVESWKKLVGEKDEADGTFGLINELLEKTAFLMKKQAEKAMEINRCKAV